jgi:hypothetical protein
MIYDIEVQRHETHWRHETSDNPGTLEDKRQRMWNVQLDSIPPFVVGMWNLQNVGNPKYELMPLIAVRQNYSAEQY